MKNKRWILWLLAAIALVALVLVARQKIHFEWDVFLRQLKLADWRDIAIAVGPICLAIPPLRAMGSIAAGTKEISPYCLNRARR